MILIFGVNNELSKEQFNELENSTFNHLMGFGDFNNIKILEPKQLFNTIDDNTDTTDLNSEPSQIEEDNNDYGFILEIQKPLFQCSECEDEFEFKNCYTRNTETEEITICDKCFRSYREENNED